MSWRDVPMPPGVAALPRTDGGLPIPYVAGWTSEARTHHAPDARLAQLGVNPPTAYYTEGAQGDGRPILGEMNPARQREVALEQLCQVCHGPANPKAGDQVQAEPFRHPLWLADIRTFSTAGDVDLGGATIKIDGRACPLIFEPWVCTDCLRYALLVCPGLIRRSGMPTPGERFFVPLRILRVRAARPVAVTAQSDQPHMASAGPAVSFVKLAVTNYKAQLPDAFLRFTGGVPEHWIPTGPPPRRGSGAPGVCAHASADVEAHHDGSTPSGVQGVARVISESTSA